MTGCGKVSSGNCARSFNLTIQQIVYAQPGIHLGEWDTQTFEKHTDYLISVRCLDLVILNQKWEPAEK